ncbi:HD domain-containing phosphohydrolase [Deinococcus depolymerans]|uniref:HD-GYP domain-containing protein n=1 Tax=Deinococcus depolymerans TaxID=392408 RepID=A0ABN1C669_9DEIO
MTVWFGPSCFGLAAQEFQPGPEWHSALEAAAQAEARARAAGDDAALGAALYRRGTALNRLGRSQEALGVLMEAVAFLPPDDRQAQALAWREAACAQRNLACDREAQEFLGLALTLAREAGAAALEVDLIEDLAQAHSEQGDHAAALKALRGSLTARRDQAGSRALLHTLVRLAQVTLRAFEAAPERYHSALTEAEAHLREVLDPAPAPRPAPEDRLAGEAHAALARVLLHRQDPAAAHDAAWRGLALLRQSGDTRGALRLLPDLARAQLALGLAAQALGEVRAALTLNPDEHLPDEHAALHLAACDACEALGDHAGALAHHRAYHALDARHRDRLAQERTRATQARVGLDATREEARLHRQRSEELDGLVRDRTAQLARSQRAVIDLLASCAEFRDAPLGPHTRWVGDAAQAVAQALGVSPTDAAQLGLAARLHDVGKIGIPDSILLKAGRLLPDEWAHMAAHTTLGAQLLSQPGAADGGPLLQLAAQIALTHHECWDGSGYPAGLAGQAIPLGGRVVRVVDTFDALISERPYKPRWTDGQALAYLREHAGTLFDPEIVRVFAGLHERGGLPDRH